MFNTAPYHSWSIRWTHWYVQWASSLVSTVLSTAHRCHNEDAYYYYRELTCVYDQEYYTCKYSCSLIGHFAGLIWHDMQQLEPVAILVVCSTLVLSWFCFSMLLTETVSEMSSQSWCLLLAQALDMRFQVDSKASLKCPFDNKNISRFERNLVCR